jgi:hypothetical protein
MVEGAEAALPRPATPRHPMTSTSPCPAPSSMARASFLAGLAFAGVALAGCDGPLPERVFETPLTGVNWAGIEHHDMQIHVHPGLGDEEYDPHQTVDRYLAEGFTILAFTPHDYDIPDDYIDNIYPWTQFAEIFERIRDVPNPTEDNQTYGEFAKEPWENRDPVALGMVSVQGSEISGHHHINSLFTSFTTSGATEVESLEEIERLGGIALFNHPGRYIERQGQEAEWYVDLYRRFDVLKGQSIYNRIDSHPEERAFFDRVAHLLGPDRPIWLHGEDDMHSERTLAWNRNVILLENFRPGSLHPDLPDGSAPDVKTALSEGTFYLWKPSEQYNRRAFDIVNVEVEGEVLRLTVDHPDRVTEVRWQTHDPEAEATVTIHRGFEIAMEQVPASARFVRAELQGAEGTIYLQPVYVRANR